MRGFFDTQNTPGVYTYMCIGRSILIVQTPDKAFAYSLLGCYK